MVGGEDGEVGVSKITEDWKLKCLEEMPLDSYELWSDNLLLGFPGGAVVKDLPAKRETLVQSPGPRRSPGEGKGNSLPWAEEPGGL